mmetsp:Transcript_8195/g.16060  ORF Transcript_8195/g.16060 Transcript_8195/m.16060 type:complete len:494 (-) Transcript_8195:2-1483(-)
MKPTDCAHTKAHLPLKYHKNHNTRLVFDSTTIGISASNPDHTQTQRLLSSGPFVPKTLACASDYGSDLTKDNSLETHTTQNHTTQAQYSEQYRGPKDAREVVPRNPRAATLLPPTRPTSRSPSYTPKSPSYARRSPSYTPRSPSHTPRPPCYNPESPSYNPRPPCYTPRSPSHTTRAPCYTPRSPSVHPQVTLLHAQIAFSYHQGAFSRGPPPRRPDRIRPPHRLRGAAVHRLPRLPPRLPPAHQARQGRPPMHVDARHQRRNRVLEPGQDGWVVVEHCDEHNDGQDAYHQPVRQHHHPCIREVARLTPLRPPGVPAPHVPAAGRRVAPHALRGVAQGRRQQRDREGVRPGRHAVEVGRHLHCCRSDDSQSDRQHATPPPTPPSKGAFHGRQLHDRGQARMGPGFLKGGPALLYSSVPAVGAPRLRRERGIASRVAPAGDFTARGGARPCGDQRAVQKRKRSPPRHEVVVFSPRLSLICAGLFAETTTPLWGA